MVRVGFLVLIISLCIGSLKAAVSLGDNFGTEKYKIAIYIKGYILNRDFGTTLNDKQEFYTSFGVSAGSFSIDYGKFLEKGYKFGIYKTFTKAPVKPYIGFTQIGGTDMYEIKSKKNVDESDFVVGLTLDKIPFVKFYSEYFILASFAAFGFKVELPISW